MAQFFLQDECVEILNQVVCEYEHMWTKTLGEMTASVLAAKAGVLREAAESESGLRTTNIWFINHQYLGNYGELMGFKLDIA
jgi:hypothetical protein